MYTPPPVATLQNRTLWIAYYLTTCIMYITVHKLLRYILKYKKMSRSNIKYKQIYMPPVFFFCDESLFLDLPGEPYC